MKPFGENLKELMALHRISVPALAKSIGESSKTVQEWCGPKGRVPRNLEAIPKIAALFGVSTHRILFGEEDPRHSLGSIFEKTELHTGLYEVSIRKVVKSGEGK